MFPFILYSFRSGGTPKRRTENKIKTLANLMRMWTWMSFESDDFGENFSMS